MEIATFHLAASVYFELTYLYKQNLLRQLEVSIQENYIFKILNFFYCMYLLESAVLVKLNYLPIKSIRGKVQ